MAGSYDSDANDNNMVKRAESYESSDSEPSRTRLGRKPIPETSSCEELIYYIGVYRQDVPFVTALIRSSAAVLTMEQNELVDDIVAGARFEKISGNIGPFDVALDAFLESLEKQFEDEYFGKRKEMYIEVYQVLDHSSFPYSTNQNNRLDDIKNALYEATGDPFSRADRVINAKVMELVKLFESDDHYSNLVPYRVVIWSMIPYHFKKLVDKLKVLAKKEEERHVPYLLYASETLNLASYLVAKLEPLIDQLRLYGGLEHFHNGMSEIYDQLIRIFKLSEPYLYDSQGIALQKFERDFRALRKEPRAWKYDQIAPVWYNFLEEFEKACPDQEMGLDENEKVVLAPEGPRNKIIWEMGARLKQLQLTATRHLIDFPFIGMGVENIVAKTTDRFLSLYKLE